MSLNKIAFYTFILFACLQTKTFARTQTPGHPIQTIGTENQTTSLLSLHNDDVTSDISHDLSKLPAPVLEMHEKIKAAAQSGDIENLRPLLDLGEEGTQVSLIEIPKDPITFMEMTSSDGEGLEALAILLNILDAGYIHLDKGKDSEVYVWPYFFALPIDKLNQPQKVELLKIVTFSDYEQMKDINAYIFYRIGITPDGHWRFFVTGDE